ncbi:hypothetical protein GCM10011374_25880 [Kocuria dechangensis]|uniref:Uncharacterized protein n=1 Tax=Kocuria dechangensis TaxID=1176249 RepID=A0A917LVT1_9MICC|nr:hypothetical protein [Kocuria dechangensis]GGG61637.1 hypothetical protein GCM10011374_25880 [Kocuria dechangensis]
MEALHLGCVGLAAAGACCTAAARPRALPLDLIGAVLMVLAMIDTAVHLSPVPTAGWALLLGGTALLTAFRRSPSRIGNTNPLHGAMTVHRNIGAILMAALLVCMDAHHSTTGSGGHAGHSANLLALSLGLGSVGYTIASIWLAARRSRISRPHRLEAALMGASVALMALASLA